MESGTALATPAPLPNAATEAGEGAEAVDSPEPSGPDTSSLAAERGTPLHDFLSEMEDDNVQKDKLAQILDGLTAQQLNQPDEDGQTPLHIAASRGLLEATKHLLDKDVGDSIKHNDGMGRQPLHCACMSGQKEIVNRLLALGADLEAKGPNGRTPLGEACYWENLDVVNELLAHRAKANVVDEGNRSLLTWAVMDSNIDLVKRLLEEEHLDLNNCENAHGWTALHRAAFWGEEEIVDILLERGANTTIQDNDGWTPLSVATCEKEAATVKRFLYTPKGDKRNIKGLETPGKEGYTPLLAAIERKYMNIVSLLIEAGADCNAEDEQGRRALRHATIQGDESIVSLLIKGGADCDAEDKQGRRALHDASAQGNDSIVTLLLEHGAMVNPRDKDQKTPLQLAFKADQRHEWDKRDEIMRSFLEFNDLNTTELGIDGVKDDVLVWAANSSNRHDIAKLLMKKDPGAVGPPNSGKWSAIEWATYRVLPQILWLLLANSSETNDSKRMVKSALELIKSLRPVLKSKEVKRQRAHMDEGEGEIPLEGKMTAAPRDSKGAEAYNTLADILQDPPFAQYTDNEQIQIRELSDDQSKVSAKFDAAVIQIFKEKGKSTAVRESRVLKDIIYQDGNALAKIMEDKMTRLKKLKKTILSVYTKKDDQRILQTADITSDPRFTWIHLPSANMDWMDDLLARIMKDQRSGPTEYRSIRGFFKDSWVEVPDRESSSRMMRPRFIERDPRASSENTIKSDATSKAEHGSMNAKNAKGQQDASENDVDIAMEANNQKATRIDANSDFVAASATYMPYLRFSTLCRQDVAKDGAAGKTLCANYKKNEKRCGDLSKAHPNSAVHASPTLDEWYYGFTSSSEFAKDKDYRNENQVATRELLPDGIEGPHWPLLRVNQLWIWTLGNKWIITAAPDPMDSSSPTLLDGVLEHLNKLGRAGESSSQPESTSDMRQLLVDYCIESYERKPVEDEFAHFENPKSIQRLSIRQLFSNSINKLGRDETILFKQLTKQPSVSEDTGKPRNTIVQHLLNAIFGGVENRKAIKQAEKLSCDVKDIRDELNILKSVATYQKDIQDKLNDAVNKEVRSNLTAKYVESDINGMDKVAERIQSSVDTTLALQQGQETVRQGRTLMVFTVVTIIFLPLSFLSSLFALDVASFQETPGWAFAVIFSVSLACVIPLATYALFSDDFTDLLSRMRETFKRAKRKLKKKPEEKPEEKSEEKSEGKSEEKPEEKSGEKSGEKSKKRLKKDFALAVRERLTALVPFKRKTHDSDSRAKKHEEV